MNNMISISPKHGVNPTIPICFWCGKERNEVALLGKLKGDAEAPMHCILDYEPCDECKALMEQGVTLICATNHAPDNRPEIQKGVYPTGQWSVLKEEAVSRIFTEDIVKEALNKRKLFADPETYKQLIPSK